MTIASCSIYSIENPDGSYTIGHTSASRGEAGNSAAAVLSKGAGYTLNENYEPEQEDYQSTLVSEDTESRNLLSPHVEILQLIETFLRFKGELASRVQALISDNWEIIRGVYLAVINKIGTLHTFTLTGIKILRKVLELAVTLMAQWQINLPSVSLDFNVGNENTNQGSSFHFDKNAFFGRK